MSGPLFGSLYKLYIKGFFGIYLKNILIVPLWKG
jgi:hypothetical protein